MTISGTSTSITVDGTGLVSTFNYDFYMGGSANYAVLVYTDADGVSTTIAAADFTITGVTSQSGGTFTYPLVGSAIATGETLTLSRVLPIVQSAAIGNQGNFYPSVVEGALDYQTMVSQQLAEGSGQTIDAQSLFGNSSASSGAGESIGIGSGLSFSGTTLVVSGISGSGTVTSVDTGAGLTGGPITGVGTVAVNTSSITPAMLSFTTGMVLIQRVSTTSSQTAVTFSSITSSYTDLSIRVMGRGTTAAVSVNLNVQFNDDTNTNYNRQSLFVGGASPTSGEALASTSIGANILPAASATASMAGLAVININGYAQTSFFKQVSTTGGYGESNATGKTVIVASYGQWKSTASITTVKVFPATGAFVDGTLVGLYGLP